MEEREIIETALANLNRTLTVQGHWDELSHRELDANITLYLPESPIKFEAEVKYEIRESILRNLKLLAEENPNFLLIAYRLYPKYKTLLQEMGINYLEANGNVFIKKQGTFILINQYPLLKEPEKEANRAFTKTGLRVFFQLLVSNENLFKTQRDLAEQAGVALGNIPLVLKGLKTLGLLLKKNNLGYQWANKDEAVDQWIRGYRDTLKATLYQGRYRLPKDKLWTQIYLPTPKTRWGGESGGDLLTNYLRPEKFTLFTDLKKTEFIKTTRLMPDPNGEIAVYETFWEKGNEKEGCAPPLLVYADLIINGDKRSLETAKLIYEEYLTEL
ncbi:type IV toxin-antitoxin system AbiEi family antitoxin [Algoriphagus sp. D3-2-R+10]|uniref:type IV toxin-antitoxin system AbiEi family antitoxin n=1 Tax=Algoriphagus aurantiacus TaxID=3103948 RepID=UPI002B3C28A3|nr:type IV toxin-antitoxin system AbiEi family antitoxin [Algoriphagus sp. D3-2-R+10]MEB2776334.1 type IV toxin-antitoxin system AbiEi family antitoxin [Algoriphagus sp. D3-2-R+10]